MLKRCLLALAAVCLFAPAWAIAQDDEQTYVYATYFYCDAAEEAKADSVFELLMKPAYEQAVADGHLTGWGWMSHHTGGKWRRLLWRSGTSVDMLLDSFAVIAENTDDDHAQLGSVFGEVCSNHDDYIWSVENGSDADGVDENRAEAGFSVYFVCDENRESRADEIVAESLAPLYNAQVENGTISSWGWLSHFVGGKYRRIATMTAPDFKSLNRARNAVIEAMVEGEATAAGEEFTSICGSHSDYMWNLDMQG